MNEPQNFQGRKHGHHQITVDVAHLDQGQGYRPAEAEQEIRSDSEIVVGLRGKREVVMQMITNTRRR